MLLAILLMACSGGASRTSPPSSPTIASGGEGAPSNQVTKLLVVVEENHSLDQMRTGMPYTFALARRYGYATHYTAISHPSLPNYLAITGGDTFGVTDDDPPTSHPIHGHSVFGQALAAGKAATLYADGMPSPCVTDNAGTYAVRHNPWAYFVDERGACARHDKPFATFAGDVASGRLPNAGMVVPDVCHDAHDCDLTAADRWFRHLMGEVFAGRDWRSGHLAVVLTADEDDSTQGNTVLTVVIHPSQHGHVVTTPLTHYSLTRLYDEVLGVAPLRDARTVPDLATAFRLPTG